MSYITIIFIACCLIISSCLSCTQSGRKKANLTNEVTSNKGINETKNWDGKIVIKMEKIGGVYQIPVEINSVRMHFIFDTGAGMVSISATEVMFLLKQGTLSKEDFLRTENFIDANGDISEGTIINLKTVKVGNRTLTNIEASVVHNLNAPLLLGQTVLEQFGKISIDNKKGEIIFE